jgi:hypothetical protein
MAVEAQDRVIRLQDTLIVVYQKNLRQSLLSPSDCRGRARANEDTQLSLAARSPLAHPTIGRQERPQLYDP